MRTGYFIGICLIITALIAYVSFRLWRISPPGWKLTVSGLFLLWMAVMLLGYALMERVSTGMATVLYEAGNTWLIAFLYLLIIFLLTDVASLCHLLPRAFLRDSTTGLLSVIGLVTLILSLGGVRYHHKYREEISLTTEKPLEQPLTIVLASDLHLGYHNRKAELGRWIDLINKEKPDLVLFGGDIIDMSLRPILEGNYAEEFRRLKAPVWTVLGNHEYYSDVEGSERFFKEAGITFLKDSTARFKGVDVIGRNDRTAPSRAYLADLANGLDGFTLLLDHQPYHLEEAEGAGIDFQFSGHTHRGQIWPISWITDAIFEKSWGRHARGKTQYYISSGLGIWGPKIRIGTRSEYLVLHLEQVD